MDVFLVYHSFTSKWQSTWSLRWSLVHLMKLYHVVPCFHARRLDKLTCSWRYMFIEFVHFTCFIHLFIGEPVHLHVLPSFITFIVLTCLFVYLCMQSLIMRWHQIQNLLVYHDTWSFGCRWPRKAAGMWCEMMASGKLLMKIAQESLRDGDRQFDSTVIVCKVWLCWEAKLRKFWEGQFGLQEGKVGMIYTFSRMNSQHGLSSQIFTIFQMNKFSYVKGQ